MIVHVADPMDAHNSQTVRVAGPMDAHDNETGMLHTGVPISRLPHINVLATRLLPNSLTKML